MFDCGCFFDGVLDMILVKHSRAKFVRITKPVSKEGTQGCLFSLSIYYSNGLWHCFNNYCWLMIPISEFFLFNVGNCLCYEHGNL